MAVKGWLEDSIEFRGNRADAGFRELVWRDRRVLSGSAVLNPLGALALVETVMVCFLSSQSTPGVLKILIDQLNKTIYKRK